MNVTMNAKTSRHGTLLSLDVEGTVMAKIVGRLCKSQF